MRGEPGFFDVDERLKRLSDLGDQLLAFTAAVDFEIFRPELMGALAYSDGSQGGRPPFDPVMMFKILVIQAANALSDERAEFLVNDRLSFMRFLGLGLSDRVPDAKHDLAVSGEADPGRGDQAAVRPVRRGAARGRLRRHGRPDRRRFADCRAQAAQHRGGKEGHQGRTHSRGLEGQARQAPAEGRDARWTVKFSKAKARTDGTVPPVDIAIPTFGYQNHVSIDREHGLIRRWDATDAAAYEGARLREGLLDKTNTASAVWADTAYRSKTNEAFLERNGFVSRIHRKKPPRRPMPETTRRANALKSKVRSGVEHVFAVQKDKMALFIRTIGIARARLKIGMANLVYNFRRLVYLDRLAAP